MIIAASSFIVASILALIFVPLLQRYVARPLGLMDQPDDNRKLHSVAIPLIGGIAVFLSVVLTVIGVYLIDISEFGTSDFLLKPGDKSQFIGLLIGSAFLLLVGVVDDSIGLRGRQKLLGQIISILILVAFGFNFDSISIFGLNIEFGTFSMLVVIVWCLAVVNSVNLLDGADGFASTIGIVMSLAMAVMAFHHPGGRILDAVVMVALAGALLGFLRYNFPPARVFLGDAGSMLIGFILAAISIRCAFKQATAYAFFAPIALLAVPFIDTAAAIVRRKLTGRSIYSVDRGHLHHSMMKRGFGPRVSLVWVAALSATTAVGGTISFLYQRPEYALVSIAIVMIVMVFGRIFGSAEVELMSNKAINIGKSLIRNRRPTKDEFQQNTVQLQGNCNWTGVWKELSDFSEDHELDQIIFDINLPWLHESFHAKRRRSDIRNSENDEWYAQVPLIVDGKIFGRVEVFASRSCRFSHYDIITNLLKLTNDIEPILRNTAVPPSDPGPPKNADFIEEIDTESNSATPFR